MFKLKATYETNCKSIILNQKIKGCLIKQGTFLLGQSV